MMKYTPPVPLPLEQQEAYRQKMQQMDLPVVHSQTRPDVTVRKEFTYTCEESEEPL